jgi:hypothetical protein
VQALRRARGVLMTKQQDLIDLVRRMRVSVFPSDDMSGLIRRWADELESLATGADEPAQTKSCECPSGNGRPLADYCQKMLGILPANRVCRVIPEPRRHEDGETFFAGPAPTANLEIATDLLSQIAGAAKAGDALMLGPQAVKNLQGLLSDLLRSAEPSLAERETATRQIPSARGDIAASGPRNGPAAEPRADVLEFLRSFISGGVNQDFGPWARELYAKLYGSSAEPTAERTAGTGSIFGFYEPKRKQEPRWDGFRPEDPPNHTGMYATAEEAMEANHPGMRKFTDPLFWWCERHQKNFLANTFCPDCAENRGASRE